MRPPLHAATEGESHVRCRRCKKKSSSRQRRVSASNKLPLILASASLRFTGHWRQQQSLCTHEPKTNYKRNCSMARHWTRQERIRQSQLIRNWRPWENSTGAKTPEGKAISSRNAYKGDPLGKLLRHHVKLIKLASDLEKIWGMEMPADAFVYLYRSYEIIRSLEQRGVTSAHLVAMGFRW